MNVWNMGIVENYRNGKVCISVSNLSFEGNIQEFDSDEGVISIIQDQLVTNTTYIGDTNIFVFGDFLSQFRDEHIQRNHLHLPKQLSGFLNDENVLSHENF